MDDEFQEFLKRAKNESPDVRLGYSKVYDDIYMAKMIARSLFHDDTNQQTVLAIARLLVDAVRTEERNKLREDYGVAYYVDELPGKIRAELE